MFVVDRSERGKLAFTGDEAGGFLDAVVSNKVDDLEPGTGRYATVLTTKGKMLGDVRVLRLADGSYWVDTERTALQDVFDALRRGMVGWRAELHKRTVQQGLLSVVGDAGLEVGPDEHDNAGGRVGDADVLVVRTNLGVDVVCDAEQTEAVRAALGLDVREEAALEVLRVETGRPRYGVDLDDSVIPQEAGLNDRAISFTKGCYPGQETVARLFHRGSPNRHLRGLQLPGPVTAGTELRVGEKTVGTLSSVVESPQHGWIGLALVRKEAAPGDDVDVDGAGPARVVELPFASA